MRPFAVAGVVGAIGYLVAMAAGVVALLRNPSPDQVVVFGPAMAFVVVAVALGHRVSRLTELDRRTRTAWKWITTSFAMLLLSNLLFSIPWGFFPAPSDILRLAMVPVLVIGLLQMPLQRDVRAQGITVALDAGTVAAAAGAFLWYLQIGPALVRPGITLSRIIAASLYPLGDIMLIFGLALVLLRGSGTARRPVRLLVAATVPWLLGDTAIGYQQTHSPGSTVAGWTLLFFTTAQFGLAAAAYQQLRDAAQDGRVRPILRTMRVSRLPYAAVATGYGLLVYVTVDRGQLYPWGGLVLCALVLTALVGVRQMLAQRQNHRMAITDALTGLANRAHLQETLTLALDRSAKQQAATAVMLTDLNGFKQVNDTMGHAAGDQLLVAYSAMLRRSVIGHDIVARLGGDEFAIVLQNVGSIANAESVARRILQETAIPVLIGDTPVQVTGSIGIALAEPGEIDADELLRRADHAMYEAKRAKDRTWRVYAAPSLVTQ